MKTRSIVLPPRSKARQVYTINVSGGRSSGYMLRCILDGHGGKLPDHAIAIFANTGKEYPQTLDFVRNIKQEWNVPITWVEYHYDKHARGVKGYPKHTYRIVQHSFASRNGEPFEQMIDVSRLLPNVVTRKCTSMLKLKPIEQHARFVFQVMRKDIVNVIGMRADEKKRIAKLVKQRCGEVLTPLWYEGVDLDEVNSFWKSNYFDLDLPYEGRHSNCDLCFMKGVSKRVANIKEDQSVADWWIRQETKQLKLTKGRLRNKSMARFSSRHSYRELLDLSNQQELGLNVLQEPEPEDSCFFCGD